MGIRPEGVARVPAAELRRLWLEHCGAADAAERVTVAVAEEATRLSQEALYAQRECQARHEARDVALMSPLQREIEADQRRQQLLRLQQMRRAQHRPGRGKVDDDLDANGDGNLAGFVVGDEDYTHDDDVDGDNESSWLDAERAAYEATPSATSTATA